MIIFYHLKNRSDKEILSEYQLQITEKDEFSLSKNEKFIPNLSDKKIQSPL